jgi:hypothetical protein
MTHPFYMAEAAMRPMQKNFLPILMWMAALSAALPWMQTASLLLLMVSGHR